MSVDPNLPKKENAHSSFRPQSDPNQYFYFKLGIPKGPFTKKEFISLAESGKIGPKTKCILNDNPSMPAKEFFGALWVKISNVVDAKEESLKEKKEVEATEKKALKLDKETNEKNHAASKGEEKQRKLNLDYEEFQRLNESQGQPVGLLPRLAFVFCTIFPPVWHVRAAAFLSLKKNDWSRFPRNFERKGFCPNCGKLLRSRGKCFLCDWTKQYASVFGKLWDQYLRDIVGYAFSFRVWVVFVIATFAFMALSIIFGLSQAGNISQ